MDTHNIQRALARLAAIPHLNYGYYPTPIEELPRLRAALGGGPRLFIKRDDYTGPGFGGNKVRKLEYALARAMGDGAEIIITTGGEKSNHARVTAAMCARLGLRSILVLNAASPTADTSTRAPASLYLDDMLGAEICRVNRREERAPAARSLAEKLRGEGRRVAEIPIGASTPLGALGFVEAIQETSAQLQAIGVRPNCIFHASSSGGTQAGIMAGCQLFGLDGVQVIGVSPDDPAAAISSGVARIIDGVGGLLELPPRALRYEAIVLDDFIGPGYGLNTPESVAAIRLLARTEGVLLDPVYTAKAMAALIDWVRRGKLTEKDTALFWHTGGQMAMFYAPMQ